MPSVQSLRGHFSSEKKRTSLLIVRTGRVFTALFEEDE